jgi:hypothetical protein
MINMVGMQTDMLKDDVKRLEEELRQAQADLLAARAAEVDHEDRALAVALHTLLCHWNHTDACGWEYETGEIAWAQGYAHTQYLEKARNVLAVSGLDARTVLTVANALKG